MGCCLRYAQHSAISNPDLSGNMREGDDVLTMRAIPIRWSTILQNNEIENMAKRDRVAEVEGRSWLLRLPLRVE